jgi:type I restriction enzyme, S subunit
MIERFSYGAVIKEIDNKQVGKLLIPMIKDISILKKINDYALEMNKLRYEAYKLEQDAIKSVNDLIRINQKEKI